MGRGIRAIRTTFQFSKCQNICQNLPGHEGQRPQQGPERQAYQKTREANSRSRSEPQTCRFYDELHSILGGSATTTPAVLFDSFNGDGGNTEAGFGDEEDDDDEEEEVVDSSQQASGETSFPDSQELFLTLEPEPVPPEPTQGCLPDPPGREGTSAACVSRITGSSPSQRLVKIRRRKNALAMKWSLSSCLPPTLTEHRRMRGGKQCQSAGKHKMTGRRGGGLRRGLKLKGGGSVMRGGRIQC
ncbi:uncharacterized protein LOC125631996 [Caretta caretta]|uniref:uncharacterized protein LOC125631996 n=1 Tax=Caretta caretta TaxID=8467 RepID=UPI003F4CA50A